MKLILYMDVYQGWKPEHCCAMPNPTWAPPVGGKRIAFDVVIPDYLIAPHVDVKVQESSTAREVT